MKLRLLIILTLGLNFSYGQKKNLPNELFGFRLGQYKSVVVNELGQPSKTKMLEDSTTLDFYLLTADSGTYVGFQYLPRQGNPIYSIQLSGKKVNRPFYGVNIGDNESKVISIFGKPDTVLTQDFDKRKTVNWEYSKLNFSILLTNETIESLRIWDDYDRTYYKEPTVAQLLEIIKSNEKSKIADILSPGLEIYYCDKIITWKNSFHKDIYEEKQSVFDFITNTDYGLASLIGKNEIKNEMNLRFLESKGTFPVYKFSKESVIAEIVLNYQQGMYKIYEIKYRCEN